MAEQPKKRWFRFRLSTVLILTAIAAWAMACWPSYGDLWIRFAKRPQIPPIPTPFWIFAPAATVGDILWPALALLAFLAWKVAWAIGPRLVQRRPCGLSSRG